MSPKQKELVRYEYLGGQDSRTLQVKRALAGYVIQDLRLALDPEKDQFPAYQLLLSNAQEFKDSFVSSMAQ